MKLWIRCQFCKFSFNFVKPASFQTNKCNACEAISENFSCVHNKCHGWRFCFATSVVNQFLTFQRMIVPLKCQELNNHWRGIISHKNSFLHHTAGLVCVVAFAFVNVTFYDFNFSLSPSPSLKKKIIELTLACILLGCSICVSRNWWLEGTNLLSSLGWVLQPGAEHKEVITEVERSTGRTKFGSGFMSTDGSAEILCCVQGDREESLKTGGEIVWSGMMTFFVICLYPIL